MVNTIMCGLAFLLPTLPSHTVTTKDIVVGLGETVQLGDRVTVQFEAKDERGRELANTLKRGLSYSFLLGDRSLPPFWTQGLSGMKKGGKRIVVANPPDAYGVDGVPPVVGGGATLQITIELTQIEHSATRPPVK
jgi:FKBP-type peptidyl-prolyl cis-trans isomerase